MSQAEASTKTRTTVNIKEPPMFKLIYINDNQTTVEFVIETLMSYFDYSTETAMEITQNIHESGSATVAVLPYEIAEQKGVEITLQARSEGHPLQVKLEPDTI
jgi:ATP-dependent Clp protease adaptor protein ClpS